MNTEDKRMRFFDMQDHPERYSNEDFREMLNDPEMQEFMHTLADFRQATVMQETKAEKLPQKPRFKRWYKVTAASIGILFISGLSFAAVRLGIVQHDANIPTIRVKRIRPTIGRHLDFTAEGERKHTFIEGQDKYENYYDVLSIGCSFYCGFHVLDVTSSSALQPQHGISYEAKNVSDHTYKTAWIEGAEGYGIGEHVTFTLPPWHPRITTIKIANGYTKTEKTWRENSRVKELRIDVNYKPYARLLLEDTRDEQIFHIGEIGCADRSADYSFKENTYIRFWIMDIYPGDKYEDTAISEITFDGLDSH